MNLETDTDILKQLYEGKNGQKLDYKDKFLREYIIGQAWKFQD